jgi:hypothetical protein
MAEKHMVEYSTPKAGLPNLDVHEGDKKLLFSGFLLALLRGANKNIFLHMVLRNVSLGSQG